MNVIDANRFPAAAPAAANCAHARLPLARSIAWSSEDILADVQALTPPLERDAYRAILWNDLCSEFDAELMWRHLNSLPIAFSPEFFEVIELWRRDEANHCRGFLRLYQLIYGEDGEDLLVRLHARAPDFEPLAPFFTDEVTVCALFAFDEIATSRSYADDFKFYDAFGVPALGKWIRHVARDEGIHFGNFVRLIQRHPRAKDIVEIAEAILVHDRKQERYCATFVLDHTGPQFNDGFLEACAETLVSAVNAFPWLEARRDRRRQIYEQPELRERRRCRGRLHWSGRTEFGDTARS